MAKFQGLVDVEFKVHCKRCGQELYAEANGVYDGHISFVEVAPCQGCIGDLCNKQRELIE